MSNASNVISAVHIDLIDNSNPSLGYEIRIVNINGMKLLHTTSDPMTGEMMLSYQDALRVANYYTNDPHTA